MEEAKNSDPVSARALGIGGAVLEHDALAQLLQRVIVLALHTVGHAHSVSITVPESGGFRTTNAIGEAALPIDHAQYDGGAGPCLEALRTAQQLQVEIGRDGHGWRQFEETAKELGVTAVLSTPLVRTPGEAIGALNIYRRDAGRFGDDEMRTAEILGEHATILLGNALDLIGATKVNEELRQALASREIIGEAKGIIMERQSCTRDEAFDILRRASQRQNRKLRDLAEELVLRVESRGSESEPAP